jgi:DNA (cytosine-5)-methyltransferase 1
MPTVIDVFCGIGGLSHGLLRAGLHVAAGVDLDGSCGYAYRENNNAVFIKDDVGRVSSRYLQDFYDRHDIGDHVTVLAGCAPCQPFSRYTARYRKNGQTDQKWRLLYAFAHKVEKLQPNIVVMENVPELARESVFADFVKSLRKFGYAVNYGLVYCPDYGVPQTRKRLILLASRFGELLLIKPTHTPENYRTVRDVIGGLPAILAGEQSASDPFHVCAGLTDISLQRIRSSRPGGTWRDWDQSLQTECHRRQSEKSNGGYGDVYGRMRWDLPSPVITTHFYKYGSGRFGHPEQDRAISLREGSLLQSFPADYVFVPQGKPIELLPSGRHIGNAVPVALGEAVGKSILNHLC